MYLVNRMGYQAIWHVKKPVPNKQNNIVKRFYRSNLFFAKRHLNSKKDAKGYLNWEHNLIPTLKNGDVTILGIL